MEYTLKEWRLIDAGSDPYQAPECRPRKLLGKVYGHPKYDDGYVIITSRIVSANGRKVTTMTGNIYVLDGGPSAEYVLWCKENDLLTEKLFSDNPIKIGKI